MFIPVKSRQLAGTESDAFETSKKNKCSITRICSHCTISTGFVLSFKLIWRNFVLGQYHLEVVNGNLRWFHRNEKSDTVFSVTTDRVVIQPDTWVELVLMYDSFKGRAVIYIDGQMIKEEISDPMKLSQDWGTFAGTLFYSTKLS